MVQAFNVTATIRLPPGAPCLGRILVEFEATSSDFLFAVAEPARLSVNLTQAPSLPTTVDPGYLASTRLMVQFLPNVPAYLGQTIRLSVTVRPAGDLPCAVEEGSDARYVAWIPDFRPDFSLELLSRATDEEPRQVRIVNLANADARFEMSFGQSDGSWAPTNRSFRLEPASRPTDKDRTTILVGGSDVPAGFDGRLRVTQRVAEGDIYRPTLTQEIDVGKDLAEARLRAYAREEAPAPSLAVVGLWVAVVALARRR